LFGVVADKLVCSNKDEECLLEINSRSLCALLEVPAFHLFIMVANQFICSLVVELNTSLLNYMFV